MDDDTAGGGSLTLDEAVRRIDKATAFAEPLRRRAEGVTIALWGLVSACIVLSNGVIDDVYGFWDAGGWRRTVSTLLFIPWAALGVLGTLAVWRIAELSARQPIPGLRRSPLAILVWLAVLLGIVVLVGFVVPVAAAGIAIVAAGLAWAAVGALDLYKATPVGRRTIIAVGVIIVAGGASYGALVPDPVAAWKGFEIVATLTLGLVPIAGGLAQALRR